MPFLSPATGAPPSSSSSMSSGSPSFDLGSGNGSLWCDFSFDSSIGNPARQHNWVVREGWIRPCLVGRKFSVFCIQTFRKQGKRV